MFSNYKKILHLFEDFYILNLFALCRQYPEIYKLVLIYLLFLTLITSIQQAKRYLTKKNNRKCLVKPRNSLVRIHYFWNGLKSGRRKQRREETIQNGHILRYESLFLLTIINWSFKKMMCWYVPCCGYIFLSKFFGKIIIFCEILRLDFWPLSFNFLGIFQISWKFRKKLIF